MHCPGEQITNRVAKSDAIRSNIQLLGDRGDFDYYLLGQNKLAGLNSKKACP